MDTPPTADVTRLLVAWSGGDASAAEQVMPLIYEELRQLARGYLRRERGDHTLQPTALVHEAYLRLVDGTQINWESRAHFFGLAARVMRRILVDHARRLATAKRGAGTPRISLTEAGDIPQPDGVDLLALDDALDRLTESYPRQGKVVELKFFGGLSAAEIGEALQTPLRSIERDWEFARAWLKHRMDAPGEDHGAP